MIRATNETTCSLMKISEIAENECPTFPARWSSFNMFDNDRRAGAGANYGQVISSKLKHISFYG